MKKVLIALIILFSSLALADTWEQCQRWETILENFWHIGGYDIDLELKGAAEFLDNHEKEQIRLVFAQTYPELFPSEPYQAYNHLFQVLAHPNGSRYLWLSSLNPMGVACFFESLQSI